MKTFNFQGEVESSKSYFNRGLILQSYRPNLVLKGRSRSRDVVFLREALQGEGTNFEVGEGGTTLRFLAFRLSRKPGEWKLRGSRRLFSRPQKELGTLLSQLGVEMSLHEDELRLKSSGWKPVEEVQVNLSQSSQFASGLLLNAWELPFDLRLRLSQERVSDGYLKMTLSLLEQAGMKLHRTENGVVVPKGQSVQISELFIEPDVSSAFVVATLAAVRGQCRLENFPKKSLQPDLAFVDIFKQIGVPLQWEGSTLCIQRAQELSPLRTSLRNSPDLFPVLAVLLSRASGESLICETPQLAYKESDRLAKTSELLTFMQVPHQVKSDGMVIRGPRRHHHQYFQFNPDEDHRLAFAAAVARSAGYRLRVLHPEVVDKSFPDFWTLISGGPGL
ncbi:MAG: 3-phosphoshikimate 1-carboxyvinyltransferase [Bdellovibrionales bacterium]